MGGEPLVAALDRHFIALSPGSACWTGRPDPTRWLIAVGKAPESADCTVRLSPSHHPTDRDVADTVNTPAEVLEEMKIAAHFLSCK